MLLDTAFLLTRNNEHIFFTDYITLNIDSKEANLCISRRITRSINHSMTSFRKIVWWRHIWLHGDGRMIIICSCYWCPGHCGRGFTLVSDNISVWWAGFSKWRSLCVFYEKKIKNFKKCWTRRLQIVGRFFILQGFKKFLTSTVKTTLCPVPVITFRWRWPLSCVSWTTFVVAGLTM